MIKVIDVVVKKYQTSDGRVFDDEIRAGIHERLLAGNVKICNACNGDGIAIEPDFSKRGRTCPTCKGSGFLQK